VTHRPLIYVETSVFGFYFDEEPRNVLRREAVVELFDQIRLGTLAAATSALTFEELGRAPEPMRSKLLALLSGVQRLAADRDEVERLTEAYRRERVVPDEFAEDAEHVAYATVCKVDVLVSLNLRHLANEWAERRICAVNLREGYQVLSIRTPEEVLKYED
jgi:hypothetical protein